MGCFTALCQWSLAGKGACCRRLAGVHAFSGVTAGRDQDLLASASPPFVSAGATLSKTHRDAEAHILVCWLEPRGSSLCLISLS